jgi:hypothetical protein
VRQIQHKQKMKELPIDPGTTFGSSLVSLLTLASSSWAPSQQTFEVLSVAYCPFVRNHSCGLQSRIHTGFLVTALRFIAFATNDSTLFNLLASATALYETAAVIIDLFSMTA